MSSLVRVKYWRPPNTLTISSSIQTWLRACYRELKVVERVAMGRQKDMPDFCNKSWIYLRLESNSPVVNVLVEGKYDEWSSILMVKLCQHTTMQQSKSCQTITWQYKLGIAHICSLDPFPFSDKQDISWCKFSVTARFTLHSWTISDEQDLDLDLAAKAPSGCSQPLTSVFPSIPLRPL